MNSNSKRTNDRFNQDKNKQTANNSNRQKDNKQPTTKNNNQTKKKNQQKNQKISNYNKHSSRITGQLKDEFELREKRLRLVYKILYIIIAIWIALFLSYISGSKQSQPIYCGLLAALTASILNVLYYIFDELRCMKIFQPTENFAKETADSRFLEIWNTFGISLLLSVLLIMLNLSYPTIISQQNVLVILFIGLILLSINGLINHPKYQKVKIIVRTIATPIVCYAFFSIASLMEESVNV